MRSPMVTSLPLWAMGGLVAICWMRASMSVALLMRAVVGVDVADDVDLGVGAGLEVDVAGAGGDGDAEESR